MQNPNLWYQTQFAPNVTQRFNDAGYELKTATTRGEHIGASTFRFYMQKGGEATLQGSNGKYQYQSNDNGFVDISALTYDYATKVRNADIRRMSPASVDAQAKSAATGCRLRANRVVLDTLQAQAGTIPGGNIIGAFANDFRISMAIQMCERMDAMGVPDDGMRFCALPSNWWNIMSVAEIFSSSDYTGPSMPFMKNKGGVKTWNGVHWLKFQDTLMPTTGAAVGATRPGVNVEGVGFGWHVDAIGSATINNGELRTSMVPMPDEPAQSLVTEFDLAAGALQLDGIFHLRAKSVSAYPTSTATL
jgi:hypothetical protein